MTLWSSNIWAAFFQAICMHRREVFTCMSSVVATGKSELEKHSWGFYVLHIFIWPQRGLFWELYSSDGIDLSNDEVAFFVMLLHQSRDVR